MNDEDYMAQGGDRGLRPLTPKPPRVTPAPLPAAPATLPKPAPRQPREDASSGLTPSPWYKYLPDYAGKLTTVRPVPGYGIMLPEVTVTARTRNRNADGSPMTWLDIRRANAYAARTGFGLNGARDFTGRVMPPEEQYVTHMARERPDYEWLNNLVQFGLGFTPGWVLGLEGPIGFVDDILKYGYKGYKKLDEYMRSSQYNYDYRDEMARAQLNRNTLGFTF